MQPKFVSGFLLFSIFLVLFMILAPVMMPNVAKKFPKYTRNTATIVSALRGEEVLMDDFVHARGMIFDSVFVLSLKDAGVTDEQIDHLRYDKKFIYFRTSTN